jgi:glycosyltransferase involved in cell wall biosynthesis
MSNSWRNKIISVVTPNLDQGEFIEQAIVSVLKQSGSFFIDYFIVDGGSRDKSLDIIKRYDEVIKSGRYPIKCSGISFNWRSGPDQGQTHALRKGFSIARGDIYSWINADDYYLENAFQKALREFETDSGLSMVYGNVRELLTNGAIVNGESRQSDFSLNLREGCQISQQGAFFTKKIYDEVGGLDESFNYCMDYDLWLKIMKVGKIKFIPDQLAVFRFHPASKTMSSPSRFKKEEDRIRMRWGGSKYNPGAVHRWRRSHPGLEYIKIRFPRIYSLCKKAVYNTINFFRYG